MKDRKPIWLICILQLCSGYVSFGSLPKFEKPLYIEYAVVIDQTIMKHFSNDKELIKLDLLEKVSLASKILYNPFKIKLVLVDIIYSTFNENNFTIDVTKTLIQFQQWIKNYNFSIAHDVIHLFTNNSNAFFCSVSGSERICQNELANGVVYNFMKSDLPQFIAHEIAYVFNISNDNGPPGCDKDNCIMSHNGEDSFEDCWSLCSQKDMYNYLSEYDWCLSNRPSKLISHCGNGIIEINEECDVDPQENGKCCDRKTCKYIEKGTLCQKSSECILNNEVCTGNSSACPKATLEPNGKFCHNNDSMCYKGKCVVRDFQCQDLKNWRYRSALYHCYRNNFKGNLLGNCGFENHKYIKCTEDDLLCGILHCRENLDDCIVGKKIDGTPFLVSDGTKCGDNKYCISQKCIRTPL